MKQKKINFKDRLNREFFIEAEIGKRIKQVLNSNKIPINSVICRNKGKIITEDHIINEEDDLNFEMVRFYDLPTILSRNKIIKDSKNPVYQKEMIFFKEGDIEKKIYRYNKAELKRFVEKLFLDFITSHKLIQKGDKIAVGFSGGKDSLALLLLLNNLKNKLPNFELCAITVAGWEDLTSFDYTKEICNQLKINQSIIKPSIIEEIFSLRKTLFDTLSTIDSNKETKIHTIYFLHQFMRRGIEEEAKKIGANKIFLGLNLEDLFSSFLGSFTTGYEILNLPERRIGELTFGFPLFPLTKKEIGLYINFFAKDFSNQGPTTIFDRGPLSRGFYYYISDSLQDLWPGIEHHFLAGNIIKSKEKNTSQNKCKRCETYFLIQNSKNLERICEICKLLEKLDLSYKKENNNI